MNATGATTGPKKREHSEEGCGWRFEREREREEKKKGETDGTNKDAKEHNNKTTATTTGPR